VLHLSLLTSALRLSGPWDWSPVPYGTRRNMLYWPAQLCPLSLKPWWSLLDCAFCMQCRCSFCNKAAGTAVKVLRIKSALSGPVLLPIVIYIRLYRNLPEQQE
jgi:hypothetical protein